MANKHEVPIILLPNKRHKVQIDAAVCFGCIFRKYDTCTADPRYVKPEVLTNEHIDYVISCANNTPPSILLKQ